MDSILDLDDYLYFFMICMDGGPRCTPRLQQELSKLSFQALKQAWEISGLIYSFGRLISNIIEMPYKQVSHGYLNCAEMVTK